MDETLLKMPQAMVCRNLVAGKWQDATNQKLLTLVSPYNGASLGSVPVSTKADVAEAVVAAQEAFKTWRQVPIKERSRPLFQYRELLLKNINELAHAAAAEAGKTVAEARAGIEKGIEVCEFALSLQNLDVGGALDVSRGVSCQFRREPLGVVAGVAPFNFPAMVPMWMFPIAITLGNTFIMKPSEKVPRTLNMLGAFMIEAGYPAGVFSLVNGDRSTVEAIIDHPLVKAVAFVGSTAAARAVYQRTTNHGKRCLALGGAKNQLIVVPDANEAVTVKGVVDSFTGCAGQRCMAASLMLAVGESDNLIRKIVDHAKSLSCGDCIGAIIDQAGLDRILSGIALAEKQGAKIILDGRKASKPKGFEKGFWIGATIIDHAKPEFACATDEIFGPVLTIIRCQNLAEAMAIEAKSSYGNATSVFTTSGAVARFVSEEATSGMVGVNIGVPVPREPFSFGGTKESKFGQGDITGVSSLDFWTDLKKITTKWTLQQDANWMS